MTTALILVPLTIAWLTVMGWILVQMQENPGTHCAPRPVNGRNLGTLPRLTTPDRPPWHTMPHPVLLLEPLPDSGHYPAEEFTDGPVVPGFMRQAVYGEVPVAEVLAADTPFPYDPDYDNCAGSPGCGDERVFFKWFGEQIACPRCYVNVFGGEPDARLVRRLPAEVLEGERLAGVKLP